MGAAWAVWLLGLALAATATSVRTANATVYWSGGEICSSCASFNYASSYACSSEIGEWEDGTKVFEDPMPSGLPVLIDGIDATVLGAYNCDVYKAQSSLMILLQRTAIDYSANLPDTGGCVCGNCVQPIVISESGTWTDWNRSGRNTLRAIHSNSYICLSSITISVRYHILEPVVTHLSPSCGPVGGGTVVNVTGTNIPTGRTLYCVFGETQVPAKYTSKEGTVSCVAPPSETTGYQAVTIRYDVGDGVLNEGAAVGDDDDGSEETVTSFYYHSPSELTSVRPSSTKPSVSVEVVVYGENLYQCDSAEVLCRFTDLKYNVTRYTAGTASASEKNNYVYCTAPAWAADDSQSFTVLLDVAINGQQYSSTVKFHYKKGGIQLSRTEWLIIGACATGFVILLALLATWLRHRHQMDGYQRIREGNYEIDFREVRTGPRIGKGTFGEVYKGTWRGAVIAIKKLPANQLSEVFLREFYKEITLMKSLRHPNVLQFLGSCLEPPNICICMEYMCRGSLYSILHNSLELFDWPLLLSTLCDASRGVLYLHTSRPPIIHRDLKSHNLLVDEHFKVKVCDFGLSTIMEQASQTMTACGTPCWTAPEVLKHLHYTEKADVYSFGIVMWECLTRKDPYFGMPPFKVIFAVGNEGLRPPLPAYTPPEYAALARECWDEAPQRRPSFEVILTRLEEMQTLGWSGDPTRPPQFDAAPASTTPPPVQRQSLMTAPPVDVAKRASVHTGVPHTQPTKRPQMMPQTPPSNAPSSVPRGVPMSQPAPQYVQPSTLQPLAPPSPTLPRSYEERSNMQPPPELQMPMQQGLQQQGLQQPLLMQDPPSATISSKMQRFKRASMTLVFGAGTGGASEL